MPNPNHVASSETTPAIPAHWNRWRTAIIALFAAGMLLAWFAQQLVNSTLATGRDRSPPSDDRIDLTIAHPSLTPVQVVSKQVDSLREAVRDNDRLIECYSLAAPANRAATGPFENFSELVRSEPYIELMTCKEYQVGTAIIKDDAAAVLVSLLTQQDQSIAFRFLLVKQAEAPFQNCWMTEGVFRLSTQDVPSPAQPGQSLPGQSLPSEPMGVNDPPDEAARKQESRID